MRFMIDILHPAHVHFFLPFIKEMEMKGHDFMIASRQKDVTIDLLDAHQVCHTILSKQRSGALSLAAELLWRTIRFLQVASKFRPDYLLGLMGPIISLAGVVLPARTVVFYDNETTDRLNRLAAKLAYAWWSPRGFRLEYGRKHFRYDGYHELAYLHPNRFTPNVDTVRSLGIDTESPYFIVRFVSWESSHDFGEEGFTLDQKRRLIKMLASHGQVYVTSEKSLPDEFEPYRLSIPVQHIHHVLAYAHLLIGESSTMASEAACLGTHALFVSKSGRGVNYEQEQRYQLVHNFTGGKQEEALCSVAEFLQNPNLKQDAMIRRARLSQDTIDVTGFLVKYFESDCRDTSLASIENG